MARAPQRVGGDRRPAACAAHRQDGAVLGNFCRALVELAEWDVDSTGDGPFGHLVGLSDVQDERSVVGAESTSQLDSAHLHLRHALLLFLSALLGNRYPWWYVPIISIPWWV